MSDHIPKYLDSLSQLSAFKTRFPEGIRLYGDISNLHDPDWSNMPKPFFDPLDFSRPVDREGFEKVADWVVRHETNNAKPWLLLHGDSRTGKTRAAHMAALGMPNEFSSELFSSPDHYRFIRAVDFAEVVKQKDGNTHEFTAFPNPDYQCWGKGKKKQDNGEPEFYFDGVLFDDADKPNFFPTMITALFDFFDWAEQHSRPLIITTQATGKELIGMMLGKKKDPQTLRRVQSIIGRLLDHSETIQFQKPETQRMPPCDSE